MNKKVAGIILSVTTLFGMIQPVYAAEQSGECGSGLTWSVSGDTLTISGSGDMTDWSGVSAAPWYSYSEGIYRLEIGEGVNSIGDYAFDGLINLGAYGQIIELPDGIKDIGTSAFDGCGKMKEISIPDSVESIGSRAFAYCSSLTEIEIPNGVTEISDYAFCYAKKLVTADIPDSVTYIGTGAFSQCTSLQCVTIPEEVSEIGASAFASCPGLKNVDYKGSQEQWNTIQTAENNGCLTNAQLFCVKPYSLLMITEPYAEAEINGTVYYCGVTGRIRVDEASAVSYTVKKNSTVTGECEAGGTVIYAPLGTDALYKEDFNYIADTAEAVEKNAVSAELFGITAYASMNMSTENGRLTIANNAKSGFYSASYPLSVHEKDTEIKITVVFPKNAKSHIILRDNANQVVGAVYRDADGSTSFGASGENFALTNTAVGAQNGSLGKTESGVPVEIIINADITNGLIFASNGDKLTGVSGYAKANDGYNGISSILIGTESGSAVSLDEISIAENTGTDAQMQKLTLNTTPYAKAVINNVTFYTGRSGVVETEYAIANADAETEISYTITKGGYESVNATVTGKSGGLIIDEPLTSESLYNEDFETVSDTTVEHAAVKEDDGTSPFGITAIYGMNVIIDKELTLSNGSNGYRTVALPLDIQSADAEIELTITPPNDSEVMLLVRDSKNQVLAAFNQTSPDDETGMTTLTFGAPGTAFNAGNSSIGAQSKELGTIEGKTAYTLNIKVDRTNKKITAKVGETEVTVHNFKTTEATEDITTLFLGLGRGNSLSLDDISVKSYVGEPDELAMLTVNTTPYAKVMLNDVTYNSGASGTVETGYILENADFETVNYTVEKGGYSSVSGTVDVTMAGVTVNAPLTINGGLLYNEDFNTVTADSKATAVLTGGDYADNLFGIFSQYGTITLTANNETLTFHNGGSGFRNVSYPITLTEKDIELSVDLTMPTNDVTEFILRDSSNNCLATIYNNSGTLTLGAGGSFNKANAAVTAPTVALGTADENGKASITVKVDESNGTVTAINGDTTATVATTFTSTLSSIYIGTGRGKTVVIDNLCIKELGAEPEVITGVNNVTYADNKATADVTIAEGDSLPINVYVAEYNGDVLVKVVVHSETVTETKTVTVDYTKQSAENSVAVYIWDNNMKPYCMK